MNAQRPLDPRQFFCVCLSGRTSATTRLTTSLCLPSASSKSTNIGLPIGLKKRQHLFQKRAPKINLAQDPLQNHPCKLRPCICIYIYKIYTCIYNRGLQPVLENVFIYLKMNEASSHKKPKISLLISPK